MVENTILWINYYDDYTVLWNHHYSSPMGSFFFYHYGRQIFRLSITLSPPPEPQLTHKPWKKIFVSKNEKLQIYFLETILLFSSLWISLPTRVFRICCLPWCSKLALIPIASLSPALTWHFLHNGSMKCLILLNKDIYIAFAIRVPSIILWLMQLNPTRRSHGIVPIPRGFSLTSFWRGEVQSSFQVRICCCSQLTPFPLGSMYEKLVVHQFMLASDQTFCQFCSKMFCYIGYCFPWRV